MPPESPPNNDNPTHHYETTADWERARPILAQAFYKELKANGLNHTQIVELCNELLQLVSNDLK